MSYIDNAGENTRITLAGKLDYTVASGLMEELKTLQGLGVRSIDVECVTLEYISSAGIRAMLFLKQRLDKDEHVDVRMHHAQAQVKDVFVLSGLGDYFEFVD